MEVSSHTSSSPTTQLPAPSTQAVEPPRRIFLRMKSSDPAKEWDILMEYYKQFGHEVEMKNHRKYHHWHQQPREYRHYVIVVDLYYVQNPDVDVRQIPHELYSVRSEAGTGELSVSQTNSVSFVIDKWSGFSLEWEAQA